MSSLDSEGDNSFESTTTAYHSLTSDAFSSHDDLSASSSAWNEGDEGEDDQEEVILCSSSLPLVRDIIKRIVKTAKSLKAAKADIEDSTSENTIQANSVTISESENDLEASAFTAPVSPLEISGSCPIIGNPSKSSTICGLLTLYRFLWGRLFRLLKDEFDQCQDLYTQSLDVRDLAPFESVTNTIHHNTPFCDVMGDLLDATLEYIPSSADGSLDRHAVILQKYYTELEGAQLIATFCAVLVVEGSRESFLDPVSMYDLCKMVVSENNQRKRLVPLSLIFSMLDQDDQATSEALAQSVPRVLLLRLSHLVNHAFGCFPAEDITEGERGSSDENGVGNGGVLTVSEHILKGKSVVNRHWEGNDSLEHQLVSKPNRSTQNGLPFTQHSAPGPSSPCDDARYTTSHILGVDGTMKRLRPSEHLLLPWKARRVEEVAHPATQNYLTSSRWNPCVGDLVGRGPDWCYGTQEQYCDYGQVVDVTDTNEVVVAWVRSADAPAHTNDGGGRLFRYKFETPHLEVVRWSEYLQVKTLDVETGDLNNIEFILICAVLGMLCTQRDIIPFALEFQTVETMLRVLDTIDLAATYSVVESLAEAAEMRERDALAAEEEEGAVDEDILARHLQWSSSLQMSKRTARCERDFIVRIGWMLNALLSHRKLAMIFVQTDGVRRVLAMIQATTEVSVMYGCTTILSQLARTSIFEELLRRQSLYFEPIMGFILEQWFRSPSTEVRVSAGAFLFHALRFPCVVTYFDDAGGPSQTVEDLERYVKESEECFDIVESGLQLAAIKCLNTYIVSHLMLSTKVVFHRHRILSETVTNSSPHKSLPRDSATVETVLGFLSAPSSALPEVCAGNVQSLLTPDRLPSVQMLLDKGFHHLLLRSVNFHFVHSRWDLLTVSLQSLCVLTVIPSVRPLIADARSPESGIAQLLLVVNDLSVSFNSGNTSREGHLLPAVVAALQVLINVTTPPMDTSDEATIAVFNHICGTFRACDGIRMLFEALKTKRDVPVSVKLNYFPMVARVVQLMATLRLYRDTNLLFEALGVHRIAQDLLLQFGDAQREYISIMHSRKLHSELDPAGRFMENIKGFLPNAFGKTAQMEATKTLSIDPLEMEKRQTIISRAMVDYSPESLWELMCRHLEEHGLSASAGMLRSEAHLLPSCDTGAMASVSAEPLTTIGGAPTLDHIVRSYLRQKQELCPHPIETLPRFDLTKRHVYLPPTVPPDESRNVLNRMLQKRMGQRLGSRAQTYENCFTYRYPAFMFDIAGGEDNLQGDSMAFCDDGGTIIIGTSEGAAVLFDTCPEDSPDDKLLEQHLVFDNEGIPTLVVSDDGMLIAAVSERHIVKIMPRHSLPVVRQEFSGCRNVRFSRDSVWVLTTCDEEHTCRLHDLNTQQVIRCFSDRMWSSENLDNVATFDATSQLVLNDAILWDVRCNDKPVFRFDRITESFASAFHPSNRMVLMDEKVWDLRTLCIVETVPTFQKTSSFHMSSYGRAIYSFREASALTRTANSIVSAVDSNSFEVIFSTEVRPPFKAFAVDPSDRYCAAIVEKDTEFFVRLFSTSSGPVGDPSAFAVSSTQDDHDSARGNDENEEEDGEDWSLDYNEFDNGSDDEDDSEEDDESSISYDASGESVEQDPNGMSREGVSEGSADAPFVTDERGLDSFSGSDTSEMSSANHST